MLKQQIKIDSAVNSLLLYLLIDIYSTFIIREVLFVYLEVQGMVPGLTHAKQAPYS